VREAVQTALATYESLGATLVDITLPHSEYGLPVYYLIAPAEASSNLARYDGVLYGHRASQTSDIWDLFAKSRGEGFGPEVKRRIMLGTYALSAGYYDQYYKKAQKVRTLIRRDFEQAFEQVDVVVGPTSPVPAFNLGERTDDPIQMYLADIFTLTVNLAGLPGISIPCGFADGLPVGLQLIGRAWDETTLLQIAHVYEQATDWHTHTYTKPKPLMQVAGNTVLGHILDMLKEVGVEEITFIVGYLGDQIREYVEANYDFRTHYAEQKELKGQAHAIAMARDAALAW